MRILYLETVSKEIDEVFEWYESQERGLGQRFIDEINNYISWISNYPETGTLIDESVRRVTVFSFPFYLYYVYQKKGELLVVSICHQRRDFSPS